MAQWSPIYDDTSKDVEGAAFFVDPDSYDPGTGKTVGAGQDGDIPELSTDGGSTYDYEYNTTTDLVEAKA